MTSVSTKSDSSQPAAETAVYLFDNWFDPIEGGLRDRVREFIHAMIEGELDVALWRPRYARHAKSPNGEAEEAVGATGHRHRHRSRSLLGSFGRVELEVPRARLNTPDGKTTEWKSKALRAYQRRADCEHLPRWHQHAPGAPCARCPVWGCGGQGHGEPGLAQGEGRLGRLERPLAGR